MRIWLGSQAQFLQSFIYSFFSIHNSFVLTNFLFLIVNLITANLYCSTIKTGSFKKQIVFFLILFNPLMWQQFLTNYNDFACSAILFSIVLCFLILDVVEAYQQKRFLFLSIIFLMSQAISIKANMIFVIFPFFMLLLFRHLRQFKKYFSHLSTYVYFRFLTIFLILVAYPFGLVIWKLIGNGKPIFISLAFMKSAWSGSPPAISNMSSFQGVHSVLTGRTSLNPDEISLDGLFAFPSPSELAFAGFPDPRIGGLGPFGGDVLFALALVFIVLGTIEFLRIIPIGRQYNRHSIFKFDKGARTLYLMAVSAIISIFLIPFNFNVRYFPQYYLLISILILILSTKISREFIKTFSNNFLIGLILLTLGANSCILIYSNFKYKEQSIEKIMNLKSIFIASKESVGAGANIKYSLNNKIGLLAPLTGEISIHSIDKYYVRHCITQSLIYSMDEEIGICVIPKIHNS